MVVRLPCGGAADAVLTDCSLDGARLELRDAPKCFQVLVRLAGVEHRLFAEVVRHADEHVGVRWIGGDVAAFRQALMAWQRDVVRRGLRPAPADRRRVAR